MSKSGALLQGRVRRQQMRVAALRALKSVSALPDDRVALEFESESGILDERAPPLRRGVGHPPARRLYHAVDGDQRFSFAHVPPGTHDPVKNWLSYEIMDLLMWVGVADLINEFRQQTLKLAPIELGAATLMSDLEVPFTYCKRCRLRLCTACYEGGPAGHAAHPYRPFNWSVRAPQHLGEELRAFAADALHALSAFVEPPR